ncbi:hypothetical protein AM500_19035 [Bacillus sp. FJAT-18017]|uniref:CBO0543 family protein n=1 Tax=Bacillus sp. FJAT-18017 TaxID=1705566 RepID=UPI0006AF7B0C|nr:CBO0543 family protein [Bacillus sp. FJAT-18017]ALC91645.1 hypothetical protein AM500_19035 [Bacillus sp. FJAT-18017]
MNMDRLILVGITIIAILAFVTLIPKNRAREAWVILLFLQVITWPAGLFVVEMGWIKYPVQLLADTNQYNRTSLTFEFFVFPIVAIIFSLYFPKVGKLGALIYYVCFTGFFTILEVIIEKTTRLVDYHGWTWYWTFITVNITLFINHKYYLWFKQKLITVNSK